MQRTATISDCGTFRYRLGRRWADGPTLAFVMLNPSTADAYQDDPTIRKCIGFAQRTGHSAIEVVNLFAFRATKPADLKAAGWPTGPENLGAITYVARTTHEAGGKVVLAWGANARGLGAPVLVRGVLSGHGIPAYALRVLDDGTPAHPLMLPYACELTQIV
ncbi:DUF1643 domain-containing protein [Cupriavidus sp. UYPR2.512]|uniref:DUF1643 domain-containing protein n=1 Tax=Cupriavidus sp. UYPR2.512 TaxID=1080187 RepID=UPI000380E0D0|nr:DUF1643 domain-containing protein [Cupriavidus sp. UYPR2.512]UIF90926.1 DUF1643 domain-containing protein [Cupriavidus necator]